MNPLGIQKEKIGRYPIRPLADGGILASARDWASNAAGSVGNWASDAADSVRQFVAPTPEERANQEALKHPDQVQAMSRITRTPIYYQKFPKGIAGAYDPGSKSMYLAPQYLMPPYVSAIPHESAHAIWDQAGLEPHAAELAPSVPDKERNFIQTSPIYKGMNSTGSPSQMANEGLGYSIGDPGATGYVDRVAQDITDPVLAERLRRLNDTAINAKPIPQ